MVLGAHDVELQDELEGRLQGGLHDVGDGHPHLGDVLEVVVLPYLLVPHVVPVRLGARCGRSRCSCCRRSGGRVVLPREIVVRLAVNLLHERE